MHVAKKCLGVLLIAVLCIFKVESKALKTAPTTLSVKKEIPKQAETSKNTTKSTVTVNDKSVSCDGSITVIDGEFFCNGQKVKPTEEDKKRIEQAQAMAEQAQIMAKQAEIMAEQAEKEAQKIAKRYPATSKKMTRNTNTTTVSSRNGTVISSGNGTVTVNGRSVRCNGSVTVTDDEVFCNGKKILPKK
jgi:hypothetical protein